jgi:hypothetical protein
MSWLGWSLGFGVLCCMLAVRASGLYYDYFRESGGDAAVGLIDDGGGILI